MGGDLNLKKSWHPSLLRNQERVWAEEKRALEERKRIDQLRRERDEERQIQELQRLHEDSGKARQQNRVDWMYQAPSSATGHYSEEMEGYLLGKRRIDDILLKNDESKKLEKGAELGTGHVPPAPTVNNARDTMTKVLADPLLEIRKREQAAYENMVKESARRGAIDSRGGDRDRSHKRRRYNNEDSRRHHRHRSHRDRSRSSEWSHRRHRDDRDDRDRRHRDRKSERDRKEDRDERDHHFGKHHEERYDRRSPRGSFRDQSPSPQPDYCHSDRRRVEGRDAGSPKNYQNEDQRDKPHRYDDRKNHRRPRHSYPRNRVPNRSGPGDSDTKAKDLEEDRMRRLAEMQDNASEMEQNRRQRIAEVTVEEERKREKDEKQRSERGRFVSAMHRQLQEDTLDERIRRSRGGLSREED
ncbi:hypothetical protein EYZ11_002085 [Aspergillus tanneri]|uniref:RNA-splicing factor n=1 Tax=Aspergillus tanneri TaxID=1220188 RepID=A0A4S3JRT9_9EURO|nr:RNA-splicing factor [Aspergillus tanneri]KAA8650548.1 RNA-splicing factor [Aspergillus tanneri]THC98426.1 hypothetical protein EYZ11_002085 [Aspergillus tanneri]